MKFTCFFPILLFTNQSVLVRCQGRIQREEIHGFIGVGFIHEIKSLNFLKDFTVSIEFELVTADKKPLFSSTWLKYRWISNELYGLPLEGNQGVSTYYIKVISNDFIDFHEIKLFISSSFSESLHEIQICTNSLTANDFMNSLDTRYALVDILAEYLMNTGVENIKIKSFHESCFEFSFLHIEDHSRCNFPAIRRLKRRMFGDFGVSVEFRREMLRIDEINSANLTLKGNCVRNTEQKKVKKLLWLKTLAPLLVLAAVIGIPVCIACYVCRGVRRRQNRMMQQQDKILKEEEAKLKAQVEEYKKACGLRQDSFDSGISEEAGNVSKANDRSNNKETISITEKKVLINKLVDRYIPQVIIDKYQNKKPINDHNSTSLNPFNGLLDIRSARDKERLRQTRNKHKTLSLPNEIQGKTQVEETKQEKANETLTARSRKNRGQWSQNVFKQPTSLLKEHKIITFHEFKAAEVSGNGNSIYRQMRCSNSDKNIGRRVSTSVINASRQNDARRKKTSLPERFNSAFNMPSLIGAPEFEENRRTRKTSLIESLKDYVINSASDLTESINSVDRQTFNKPFVSNNSDSDESCRTTPSLFDQLHHGIKEKYDYLPTHEDCFSITQGTLADCKRGKLYKLPEEPEIKDDSLIPWWQKVKRKGDGEPCDIQPNTSSHTNQNGSVYSGADSHFNSAWEENRSNVLEPYNFHVSLSHFGHNNFSDTDSEDKFV